jgi:hypothetical protein
VVRVSSDGLAYRSPEIWSNKSVLSLSQKSFPEGSTLPQNTEPGRFPTIVDQYAALATSDAVIASLKRQRLIAPRAGETAPLPIAAAALPSAVTGAATPLLELTAVGKSPAAATRLAVRATDTFISIVKARQQEAGIPESRRVQLDIVTRAGVPRILIPRKMTKAMFILVAGVALVVAAAFIRDNIKRKDDSKRGGPAYQLEAAPSLDSLGPREAAAPAPDAVFGDNQAARPTEADLAADVGPLTIRRRSSG